MDLIRNYPNLKKADIVLITDGLSKVGDEWRSRFLADKQRLSFTLYGVLIGGFMASSLEAIANTVVQFSDLQNDSDVGQIFGAL